MKNPSAVDQIERLEDDLQAIKWIVRPLTLVGRGHHRPSTQSIVAQTAGLLRGRLPPGRTHQRRLRQEWEHRFQREAP